MRIQSLSHCKYQHEYHIVWGTKYRRKFLKSYTKQAFESSVFQIVSEHPELYVQAMNVDEDHVHLQIEIAPSVSVASAVQILKARSSFHLKQQFKFIREMYLDGSIWSVGYYSSTIGLNENQVKKYIEEQGRRDFPTTQKSFGFS